MFHRRCGAAPMSRLSPEQRIRKRGLPPVSVSSPEVVHPQIDELRPEHSDRNWVIGAECCLRQAGTLRSERTSHTFGCGGNKKRKERPPSIGDRSSLIRQNNASSSRRRLDLITRPKLIGGCVEATAGTSLLFS